MSYYDMLPVGDYVDDWDPDGDEEREFMVEVFKDITDYDFERRRYHDTDGFYAYDAFSAQCLELGHQETDGEDPYYEDGTHITGWDGESICVATRYSVACTQCEGECSYWDKGSDLWDWVRESAGRALAWKESDR